MWGFRASGREAPPPATFSAESLINSLNTMPSFVLKAHFDGKQIVLDEPYALSPSSRLLVLVMPESGNQASDKRMDLATASLNRAYGDHEPDYSLEDVKTLL